MYWGLLGEEEEKKEVGGGERFDYKGAAEQVFRGDGTICILIVLVVTCVKTHRTVHKKEVNFTVCKLKTNPVACEWLNRG